MYDKLCRLCKLAPGDKGLGLNRGVTQGKLDAVLYLITGAHAVGIPQSLSPGAVGNQTVCAKWIRRCMTMDFKLEIGFVGTRGDLHETHRVSNGRSRG